MMLERDCFWTGILTYRKFRFLRSISVSLSNLQARCKQENLIFAKLFGDGLKNWLHGLMREPFRPHPVGGADQPKRFGHGKGVRDFFADFLANLLPSE